MKGRPMKIYIAAPLSAQTEDLHNAARLVHQNVQIAIRAAIRILEKGHEPFVPHLYHYLHIESPSPISWETYLKCDIAWLHECNGLLYLGSSRGADIELAEAKKRRLHIFYDVEDIPDYALPEWTCEELDRRISNDYDDLERISPIAKKICRNRMMNGHTKKGMGTFYLEPNDMIADMIEEASDLGNYGVIANHSLNVETIESEKVHIVTQAAKKASELFFNDIREILEDIKI